MSNINALKNEHNGAAEDPAPPVLDTPVDVRSVALALLAGIAVIFTLHWAREVFIPLMLGLMISYALSPIVNWMHRGHIPRAIGAAILLISIVGGSGSLIYTLSDDAAQLIESIPDAVKKLRLTVRREQRIPEGTMGKVQRAANELERAANDSSSSSASAAPNGVVRVQVENPKLDLKNYLWMGTLGAAAFVGQASIVLFLSYFILVSGNTFRRKLVALTGPTLSKKRITLQVLDEINNQIQRYLLVQVFTSILVGVATWLAFVWIGLEH
ncbi:MAG: AI-2E family transporter, partial [Gallionellaceae bacterium]|nr:AI-2E family transporter [Gallionellaceae bacterium]